MPMPSTSSRGWSMTHCTISSAASGVASRSMAAISRPVMPWSAWASRKAARIASMAAG
jgi:hypothetical protein